MTDKERDEIEQQILKFARNIGGDIEKLREKISIFFFVFFDIFCR